MTPKGFPTEGRGTAARPAPPGSALGATRHDRAYRGRKPAGATSGVQARTGRGSTNALRRVCVSEARVPCAFGQRVPAGLLRHLIWVARRAGGGQHAPGKVQGPAPGRPNRADSDALCARAAQGRQAPVCIKVAQGCQVAPGVGLSPRRRARGAHWRDSFEIRRCRCIPVCACGLAESPCMLARVAALSNQAARVTRVSRLSRELQQAGALCGQPAQQTCALGPTAGRGWVGFPGAPSPSLSCRRLKRYHVRCRTRGVASTWITHATASASQSRRRPQLLRASMCRRLFLQWRVVQITCLGLGRGAFR